MTKTPMILAALIVPGIALANVGLGEAAGTTEAEIRAYLEAQGYVIEETEAEDGMIEIEALLDGTLYEIEVDQSTGEIVEIGLEDEDDDDDDDDDDDN